MKTPFHFTVDQSTLVQAEFYYLWIEAGYTAIINWGDGNEDTIDTDSNYTTPNFTHNYAATGTYIITIYGDTDHITYMDSAPNDWGLGGDVSDMVLPPVLRGWHMWTGVFTGDVTDWIIPRTLQVFNLSGSNLSGNPENWNMPDGLYDLHLEGNDFECDVEDLYIPAGVAHLTMNGTKIYGDITNIRMPSSSIYGTVILNLANTLFTGDVSGYTMDEKLHYFNLSYCNITGDLSSCDIPDGNQAIRIESRYGTQLTGLPRGSFRWVSEYFFSGNNCATSEIDSVLAHIDAYFVGGVVPLTDCTYLFDGTGMGIPSAAGLASKASIEGKYTAASKTATITVNT